VIVDNRPPLQWLIEQLSGVPDSLMAKFDPPNYAPLQRLLDASIAYVEDVATTAFNSTAFYDRDNFDVYDGNTTNQMVIRKRPLLSIQALQVVTPILGYTRVYAPAEIKNYVKQGVVKVFTYKLAVEQALLQTVDYQAWGSLFPPLPQAVQVAYTYGYPLFDTHSAERAWISQQTMMPPGSPYAYTEQGYLSPDPINGPATSFDGGITWEAGDTRDPEMMNWLKQLQQAVVCDAAASFLGQMAATTTGVLTSVSFDGYSRGINPMAFSAQVQSLIQKRDELLNRRKRQFYLSTVGGHF
jgi:hypothetical protein